jgi:Fic family protein
MRQKIGSESNDSTFSYGSERATLPPDNEFGRLSARMTKLRRQPFSAAIPFSLAARRIPASVETMSLAAEAQGEIQSFTAETAHLPIPLGLITLRSESLSSSQIEHVDAPARAVAEAAISERLMGNATLIAKGIRALEDALSDNRDVDAAWFVELQHAILGGDPQYVTTGWRRDQVWLGGRLPQTARYVPPVAARVPEAMTDLIAFIHRTDLQPIVHAAAAHAQFENIHPFRDGNGRTGRGLIQRMYLDSGLVDRASVPVSSGIVADLPGYESALIEWRDGHTDPVVALLAHASLRGVDNVRRLSSDLDSVRAADLERMSRLRSDATARRIAALSLQQPVLSTRYVVDTTGLRELNVLRAFDTLTALGVLTETTSKRRNRIWGHDGVLDALDDFERRAHQGT